jgi:tetratricopeptide (TPR) repeat protein
MKDETSIFGAKPERLDRLVFEALDQPEPEEQASPTASLGAVLEQLGGQIGRYKLLSILGEGGMGIVYLAEQKHPIRRQVALKVIKPGMDSKRVIARFEAERQALALLDHPNIAHVYDAGTTENGRPYFVMEYVKGLSITEHCDRHKLTIEDRLNLFRQVCLAVHHAHQKGIIHRDIKPSNILVSLQDDQAVPKIIDFGVAKALAQPLTERTLVTEQGQLFGTPEYMSPEQADMANEDIDTRSDIYSLGVLLYVLLTGVLPFDSTTFREGGIEHIRQVIRETDPKTPSTRLTKLGEEAKRVAESRRTEIATLAKKLHKELEWIPLKAMRKERAERYRSASEFAEDIENYLNGEPLIAGPAGTGYKLKKFVRRNSVLVGGVAAILVVLIVGVVVSTILAIGQARARAEAQLIADFLENDVLGSAEKARVGEATVSYILNAASQSLEGKFKDKPLIEASIRHKLGFTWRQIGETDEAEQHFLRAIDIYKQHYGEEHLITLNIMDYLGYIYEDQGRYHDMERLWTMILEIRQRVYGVEYPASTINGLAVALCHLGKYEEAESLFNKALQLEKAWYEVGGEGFNMLPYLKCNLARVYTAKGRYEAAEQLLRKNIEAADAPGMDVKYGVNLRYSTELAGVYREWGRYDDAEPLFNKTLEALRQIKGDEHFFMSLCMYGLVRLYVDQDRYEEAEKLFGEALPIARRRLREEHPVTLRLVNTFAVLRTKQKQHDEAERLFDEALKGRQRELGDDHPDTLETKNDLAVLYKELSRYQDSEDLLLQAVKGRRLKLGDDHPRTLKSLNNLIELYESWGKPEKADEWRAKLPDAQPAK